MADEQLMDMNTDLNLAEDMALRCSRENDTLAAYREKGDILLDEFLDLQSEKASHNRSIKPIREPDDFFDEIINISSKRLGEQHLSDIREALNTKIISTADHHGAMFCAQSFQGDILYYHLLRKSGFNKKAFPVLTGGQVELGSGTYARGICVYAKDEKELMPFFRKLDQNVMAMNARAINQDMIDKFRKRYLEMSENNNVVPDSLHKALTEILDKVYENEKVLNAPDYATQTTIIGEELFSLMHVLDGAFPVYIEAEEVARGLLVKELKEDDSILSRILSDKGIIKKLQEITTKDGLPLAAQLFGTCDEKGRKVFLKLDENGVLSGKSMSETVISFDASRESLISLLLEKKIFTGLFTAAVLFAFERGITWYGGMFQATYLPEWKKCFAKLLKECGYTKEAENVNSYDCSGYISGPMFALSNKDDCSYLAGPVEMVMSDAELQKMTRIIESTRLNDSHIIGLFEMYLDFVPKKDRPPHWYKNLAKEMNKKYTENIINGCIS
ncbi:hypothetical protein [Butyrivibrio sp. JL13D10]|uniref:hypothetical protein n=1 Tax=Butyrivibrio sp. JL13D10 TaxID=3236815 RepID=UPI0038B6A628